MNDLVEEQIIKVNNMNTYVQDSQVLWLEHTKIAVLLEQQFQKCAERVGENKKGVDVQPRRL